MKHKPWPYSVIQWLLVLAIPICLLAADLRLVTGHWFAQWEYGKADFPPDPYGLSTADRARLAEVSIDYLATNADLSLLADLRLPDGRPAFNERELQHMADVQTVFNQITLAGVIAALALLGGIAALLASGQRQRAPAALLRGSLLTLGLLAAVGAYMALNWGEFFTTFHRLFFEGDTWIFPYSNTLIRLFPTRFWMDVAAVIVGLLVVGAVGVGTVGWLWMQRLDSRS